MIQININIQYIPDPPGLPAFSVCGSSSAINPSTWSTKELPLASFVIMACWQCIRLSDSPFNCATMMSRLLIVEDRGGEPPGERLQCPIECGRRCVSGWRRRQREKAGSFIPQTRHCFRPETGTLSVFPGLTGHARGNGPVGGREENPLAAGEALKLSPKGV
jgi:hypothetical protein